MTACKSTPRQLVVCKVVDSHPPIGRQSAAVSGWSAEWLWMPLAAGPQLVYFPIRPSDRIPLYPYWSAKMILSGEEIRRRQGSEIVIDPFDSQRINPNSYNLTLHDELLMYEEVVLDVAAPNRYTRLRIPPEGLTLHPGQLYLGRTVERTETQQLVPRVQGRSSLARLGLLICPGGSLGSVGYCGTWTLEMFVIQPVKIYPFMLVCQIYFHELVGEIGQHGCGKYHNSTDIQPSQMYREFGGDSRNQQLELSFDNLHKS